MKETAGTSETWTPRTLALLLGGMVVLYQAAFHAWYGGTLLGRYPVLDGREILLLAEAMAQGTLPPEPFYRAPLYSGLLALFFKMGLGEEGVIWMARLINLAAHLGGAMATAYLARWFWGNNRAGWTAFVVAGMYPVTLHFAGDPLDTVFSLGLFLGALAALVRTTTRPEEASLRRAGWFALAGTGFVLAVATRPHFLVALPIFLLPLGVFWIRRRSLPLAEGLTLGGVILGGFGLLGLWNLHIGGEFRVLPWQGPSNWYAANQPGAHGKFFVHQVELPLSDGHTNPTRRESEFIFQQETGHPGGWTIDEFNAFWQEKNAALRREQALLLLSQMIRKGTFLLHHTEQYNNKTYAFHAARTPLLRYNPLGWALLLTLAAALVPLAWRQDRTRLLALALTFLLLAGGILLYFVSARFRLPLVPFLMILSAGWAVPAVWRQLRQSRRLGGEAMLAGGLALFAGLFPWPGVQVPDTTIEDRLLLAQAADQLGEDETALYYARAVLNEQPDRLAALEVQTNVRLNQFLLALWAEEVRPGDIVKLEDELAAARQAGVPLARWTLSLIRWQQGRFEEARTLWRELAEEEALRGRPELGALLLHDPERREEWIAAAEDFLWSEQTTPSPYLLAGLALAEHPEGPRRLAQTFPPTVIPRLLRMWQELLPPPPPEEREEP